MALDPKTLRTYGVLSGAALTKGFLIYFGFILGRTLDTKFNTYPLFMVLGMILFSILGLFWILYLIKRLN